MKIPGKNAGLEHGAWWTLQNNNKKFLSNPYAITLADNPFTQHLDCVWACRTVRDILDVKHAIRNKKVSKSDALQHLYRFEVVIRDGEKVYRPGRQVGYSEQKSYEAQEEKDLLLCSGMEYLSTYEEQSLYLSTYKARQKEGQSSSMAHLLALQELSRSFSANWSTATIQTGVTDSDFQRYCQASKTVVIEAGIGRKPASRIPKPIRLTRGKAATVTTEEPKEHVKMLPSPRKSVQRYKTALPKLGGLNLSK